MRNYLVLLLVVAMIAAVGCGGKKKVVKKYPAGTSPTASQKNTPAPLGRAGGPADSQTKADNSAAADTTDTADVGEADSEEAPVAAKAAPAKRRYVPGRRRPPPLGRSGGGTTPEEEPKVEPPPTTETKSEDKPSEDDQAAPVEEAAPPTKKRSTLYDRAVKAFINQNENEAFQYLYAHAAAEDNALTDHPISWYAGLKEPRMGLRWGVAIDYIAGRFDGDPPVIGDPVEAPSSGGGGADNDLGMGGGARTISGPPDRNRNRNTNSEADAPEDPQEQLAYYTGDFGKLFIQRIEMRRNHPDGFFGDALKSIDLDATFDDDVAANNDDRPPAASEGSDDDFRISSGSRNAGSRNNRRRDNNRASDEEKPEYEADPTSLAPGVMFLGVGKKAAMIQSAKDNGIDLLLVFTVKITHSESRNLTKSSTQARLIATKTGEELASTKALNNIAVARKREGSDDDPVEAELDKIFNQAADINFKSDRLPDALEKYASSRVDQIIEQEYMNPLPPLVEVKTYHERGWITQSEYVAAVETLIGEKNAKSLLDGEVEDRENALKKWLPGQFDLSSVSDFR